MRILALLTIVVWPNGLGEPSHSRTLHCVNARSSAFCARLAELGDPFAPTPPGTACTEIYGGPGVARVKGTFRGRPVWATFRRRDGCEIARWTRIGFLLV
jgi:hypothetical protein